MPNNSSLPYPIPSLFASQKLFSPKGFSDGEISMSPTSTLETKHFSSSNSTNNTNRQRNPPTGLGLIDILSNDTNDHSTPFLFGSQPKIQLPFPPPQSPTEFGVKTKDSQLAPPSPLSSDPWFLSQRDPFSPELLTDMELSEEYTCVITHGPNPKTTHIFDNFVVESYGGNFGFFELRRESDQMLGYSAASSFLSSCHACKKNLSKGRDIFTEVRKLSVARSVGNEE